MGKFNLTVYHTLRSIFVKIGPQLPVKRRLCLFLALIFKQILKRISQQLFIVDVWKFLTHYLLSHALCWDQFLYQSDVNFHIHIRGYYPWESAHRYLVSYTGYCCNLKYFHSLQYMYLEYQPSIACMKGFFFQNREWWIVCSFSFLNSF